MILRKNNCWLHPREWPRLIFPVPGVNARGSLPQAVYQLFGREITADGTGGVEVQHFVVGDPGGAGQQVFDGDRVVLYGVVRDVLPDGRLQCDLSLLHLLQHGDGGELFGHDADGYPAGNVTVHIIGIDELPQGDGWLLAGGPAHRQRKAGRLAGAPGPGRPVKNAGAFFCAAESHSLLWQKIFK